MPTVITCPKCGGNGTITLGMTWEEAINLAECVMRNEIFQVEAVQCKSYQTHTFYVVTVTERIFRNTITELTSYKHYLQFCEELKKKEDKK